MKYFLCKYIPRRGDFLATMNADESESIECSKTASRCLRAGNTATDENGRPEHVKSRESLGGNAMRNYLNPSGI
jgi:hypothetical protein